MRTDKPSKYCAGLGTPQAHDDCCIGKIGAHESGWAFEPNLPCLICKESSRSLAC